MRAAAGAHPAGANGAHAGRRWAEVQCASGRTTAGDLAEDDRPIARTRAGGAAPEAASPAARASAVISACAGENVGRMGPAKGREPATGLRAALWTEHGGGISAHAISHGHRHGMVGRISPTGTIAESDAGELPGNPPAIALPDRG